ncbi:DUF1989 domain-containing protein [Thermoproteota archaeon]
MKVSKLVNEILVPAAHAKAFEVKKSQLLSIIDIEGGQIGDFISFNRHNNDEKFSTSHTRLKLFSLKIKVGDKLWTNYRNPMFEIIEDTVGTHDILIPACDEYRYLVDFGVKEHRSCVANFEEVLHSYKIKRNQFPDPLNVFENTPFDQEGNLVQKPTISKAGDRLVLKALMDTICAVSSCPMDLNVSGNNKITDLLVKIFEQ